MALVVTNVSNPEAVGHHREVIVTFNLDSSYPTGGEKINPANWNNKTPIFVLFEGTKGYRLELDKVNNKIVAYASGGTEVADAVDVSAVVGAKMLIRYV